MAEIRADSAFPQTGRNKIGPSYDPRDAKVGLSHQGRYLAAPGKRWLYLVKLERNSRQFAKGIWCSQLAARRRLRTESIVGVHDGAVAFESSPLRRSLVELWPRRKTELRTAEKLHEAVTRKNAQTPRFGDFRSSGARSDARMDEDA